MAKALPSLILQMEMSIRYSPHKGHSTHILSSGSLHNCDWDNGLLPVPVLDTSSYFVNNRD